MGKTVTVDEGNLQLNQSSKALDIIFHISNISKMRQLVNLARTVKSWGLIIKKLFLYIIWFLLCYDTRYIVYYLWLSYK